MPADALFSALAAVGQAALLGALTVGFLAHLRAALPGAHCNRAFPGVVAMVPGLFAFGAVAGSLEIAAAGARAAPALVAETISLCLACMLMTIAIAVGLAAPLIVLPARPCPA